MVAALGVVTPMSARAQHHIDLAAAPTQTLALAPQVSIGSAGGPEYEFFRVSHALFLPDGRIGVVNSGTNEMRIFSSTGEFITSFGGQGQGPGEFQYMAWAFRLPPDSVVVWDAAVSRASVFSTAGEFGRTVPLTSRLMGGRLRGISASRGLLYVDWRPPGAVPAEGEIGRISNHWFLYDATGERRDSLGSGPGMAGAFFGGGREMRPMLFRLGTTYAVAGERLWLETGDARRVEVLNLADGARMTVGWDGPSREILPGHVQAEIRSQLALYGDSDRVESMRRDIESRPRPDSLPVTVQVLTDHEERAWVELFRRPGEDVSTTWLVIDQDGALVKRVDVGRETQIFDVRGDLVLVLERDPFDVEHVRVYQLVG